MTCCVPGGDHADHAGSADSAGQPEDRGPQLLPVPLIPRAAAPPRVGVPLPGGTFAMGDEGPLSYPEDGEGPVRDVTVAPFTIDRCAVTTAEYADFVAATGYVTDAERLGRSFVFAGALPDDAAPTRGVVAAPWWREVPGASWRRPEGPGSDTAGRGDHPVVHVSWYDAHAFAAWSGVRLPTEPEWEYAARAGAATTFPWGEELEPGGVPLANTWHGTFPTHNTLDDGYAGTCPVEEFPPNAWGLHNMIGNVWEWTADRSESGDPADPALVLKGGSFLCHVSYCHRYRPGARSTAAPDSSASNVGFRCAR